MFDNEIESLSNAAVQKYNMTKNSPLRYLAASIIAGFFIVIATILSNVTAATFNKTSPEAGKLISSLLFSTAIVLVVLVGGELFTGSNMTMAFGLFNRRVKFGNACRVWVMSYIGNFLGTFILGGLFVLSGCASDVLTDYYSNTIPAKLDLNPFTLVIRGILCNYLVCLAVFVGTKLKSEGGKIAIMFCIITTFVIAGFEHSIANMAAFTISGFLLGGLPADKVIINLVCVTLGNMVGGIFLLALPIQLSSSRSAKK